MKIKRIQSQNILTEKQLPCTLMPMHDTEIVMYTTSSCSDCKRSKAWFAAQNVSFHEINIEDNEEAVAIVKKINNGLQFVPTIVFPDGSVLVEPSNQQLAEKMEALHI